MALEAPPHLLQPERHPLVLAAADHEPELRAEVPEPARGRVLLVIDDRGRDEGMVLVSAWLLRHLAQQVADPAFLVGVETRWPADRVTRLASSPSVWASPADAHPERTFRPCRLASSQAMTSPGRRARRGGFSDNLATPDRHPGDRERDSGPRRARSSRGSNGPPGRPGAAPALPATTRPAEGEGRERQRRPPPGKGLGQMPASSRASSR